LWGVNWKKAWPVLAQGAWVPVVLLMYLATLAWSRLDPSEWNCLGIVTIPNGWWQLGSISALVGVALFCGWLQTYMGWTPHEVNLEPAPAGHGHSHDHH
jgi:hypothetical protein